MELKVFWGILYARGYRELHSDSLDPDGCLVRSSDFDTHKNNEIKDAKQKQQVHHRQHHASKISFFVTGEVYLLDIGLLMGAITLTLAKVNITFANSYFFTPHILTPA